MRSNQRKGVRRVANDLGAQAGSTPSNVTLPDNGAARVFNQATTSFDRLSNRIGKMADNAAKKEGAAAGRAAGLDPEFRTSGKNTIRAEAFDRAGLETYKSRVKVEIESDLDEVFRAHSNDPAELAKVFEIKQAEWRRRVPEELRPEIDISFQRSRLTMMRQATRAQVARVQEGQSASLQDELSTRLKGVHQKAFALGLDDTADEILAGEVSDLTAILDRTGLDGELLISPVQAGKVVRAAKEEIINARLLGAFGRLENIGAKVEFLKSMDADFSKSLGLAKEFDIDGYQAIRRQLEGELRKAGAEANAVERALNDEVKSVARLAEKGFSPKPEDMAALRSRIATIGTPELAGALQEAEKLARWQVAARKATPAELDSFVRSERLRLAKGGAELDGVAVKRLDLAEKIYNTMRTELKRDALGWASRAGVIEVAPLDFSRENMAGSLLARIAQAETVAKIYKIAPQYLRPEEVRGLSVAASEGGAVMIDMARSISSVAPEQAQAILGQIFEQAPVVAMVGGLVADSGDGPMPEVALDAANGLRIRKLDGFKTLIGSARVVESAANSVLSGALNGLPKTKNAAMSTANAAYEVRARRQGLSEFDEELWKQIFNEALGQRVIGNETYGGILKPGWFSGRDAALVVPSYLKLDDFDNVIDAITDEDIDFLAEGDGPILGDRPLTAGELRQGQLVSVGNGRYRIAMGDVNSDPQWIGTQSGQAYVLDLNHLATRLRRRLPDAFLGGALHEPDIDLTPDQVEEQLDDDAAEAVQGEVGQ